MGPGRGEHRNKALIISNTKEIVFESISKDEQLLEGKEGNSERGLTFEGNVPPVWGTGGGCGCGQRSGNILNLFQVWCGP